jgi:hypothetical protein
MAKRKRTDLKLQVSSRFETELFFERAQQVEKRAEFRLLDRLQDQNLAIFQRSRLANPDYRGESST